MTIFPLERFCPPTREILSPHSRDFVPPIFLKVAPQACFRGYQKAVSSVRTVRTVPASRPPLQTGAALPIIDLRATHDRKTLEKEKARAADTLFFQGYLTEKRADRLHAHRSHYKARRAFFILQGEILPFLYSKRNTEAYRRF